MTFIINNSSFALVLAAGLGTRLLPLTKTTPKPLIEVRGKSMLERVCAELYLAGFRHIIINTHHLHSQIEQSVGQLGLLFPEATFYICHEPQILDVGGAIKNAALKYNITELLVYNCDILVLGGKQYLEAITTTWNPEKMDALLYLKDKSQVHNRPGHGDFNISHENVLSRNLDLSSNQYIYTGISIYKTRPVINIPLKTFNIMHHYVFPGLDNGKFYGLTADFDFIDIGSLDNLAYAREAIT